MRTAGHEQDTWLKSATAWQKKTVNTTVRAGTDIAIYLQQYLSTAQESMPVAKAFLNVVDEALAAHCHPVKYERGILFVQCSPGPFLHQLRTREREFTEQIKQLCPKAKFRALRFTVKN